MGLPRVEVRDDVQLLRQQGVLDVQGVANRDGRSVVSVCLLQFLVFYITFLEIGVLQIVPQLGLSL